MSVKFARCALWGEGEEAPRKRGCYSNSEFSRHYMNSGTCILVQKKYHPVPVFSKTNSNFVS